MVALFVVSFFIVLIVFSVSCIDCFVDWSETRRIMFAVFAAFLLRSMPSFSIWSVVWRIPAVSMKRNCIPSICVVSSIVSRVVP